MQEEIPAVFEHFYQCPQCKKPYSRNNWPPNDSFETCTECTLSLSDSAIPDFIEKDLQTKFTIDYNSKNKLPLSTNHYPGNPNQPDFLQVDLKNIHTVDIPIHTKFNVKLTCLSGKSGCGKTRAIYDKLKSQFGLYFTFSGYSVSNDLIMKDVEHCVGLRSKQSIAQIQMNLSLLVLSRLLIIQKSIQNFKPKNITHHSFLLQLYGESGSFLKHYKDILFIAENACFSLDTISERINSLKNSLIGEKEKLLLCFDEFQLVVDNSEYEHLAQHFASGLLHNFALVSDYSYVIIAGTNLSKEKITRVPTSAAAKASVKLPQDMFFSDWKNYSTLSEIDSFLKLFSINIQNQNKAHSKQAREVADLLYRFCRGRVRILTHIVSFLYDNEQDLSNCANIYQALKKAIVESFFIDSSSSSIINTKTIAKWREKSTTLNDQTITTIVSKLIRSFIFGESLKLSLGADYILVSEGLVDINKDSSFSISEPFVVLSWIKYFKNLKLYDSFILTKYLTQYADQGKTMEFIFAEKLASFDLSKLESFQTYPKQLKNLVFVQSQLSHILHNASWTVCKAFLKGKRNFPETFVNPSNSVGPDLLGFISGQGKNTFIPVFIQLKTWNQSMGQDALDHAIATTDPSHLYTDINTRDPNSFYTENKRLFKQVVRILFTWTPLPPNLNITQSLNKSKKRFKRSYKNDHIQIIDKNNSKDIFGSEFYDSIVEWLNTRGSKSPSNDTADLFHTQSYFTYNLPKKKIEGATFLGSFIPKNISVWNKSADNNQVKPFVLVSENCLQNPSKSFQERYFKYKNSLGGLVTPQWIKNSFAQNKILKPFSLSNEVTKT